MRCCWCHNPEGLDTGRTLWHFEKKCIGCGSCAASCPVSAVSLSDEGRPIIDREKCTLCGNCTELCPTTALCFMGEGMTVARVLEQVASDLPFMQRSGGGITLSGGEPTMQAEFSLALLAALRQVGFSTCMESCMYCAPEVFEKFLLLLDSVIVDIKLFDDTLHKRYTQCSNARILENFRRLAAQHDNVLVRIPLIPSITDFDENIRAIADFVHDINERVPIELINYNPLAPNKYRIMGKDYAVSLTAKPLSRQRLDELCAIITAVGVRVVRN